MKQTQKLGSKRAAMKKYVFVLGSAATLVARGVADTVGLFGFESFATASSAGLTSGNLPADSGSGTAFAVHTASASYTFPSGNGSPRAFSSTNFAINDYFQFQINATGYTNLAVSFDTARSTTGAPSFSLQYSTDGTNFVTLTTFNVFTSSTTGTGATTSGTVSFVTGSSNSAFNVSANLSTVTGLNNALDYFRIVAASTGASTGTNRVDNFLLTGTASTSVPEPSTLALFSAAGVGAVLAARRRKKA